jgi:nucleotide-binding universal stress UspA family protein
MLYKNVLVALACKDTEVRVIGEAVRIASEMHADLTVLHVNDPRAGKPHMMMDALPLITEVDIRNLFREAGFVKEADQVDIEITTGESYPNEIARATQDADLLILGHCHRNRFLTAFVDSVDEQVTNLVSCPVMVVPRGQAV